MGPRICMRGKGEQRRRVQPLPLGFNGAAHLHARKATIVTQRRSVVQSFNGAAHLHARKATARSHR